MYLTVKKKTSIILNKEMDNFILLFRHNNTEERWKLQCSGQPCTVILFLRRLSQTIGNLYVEEWDTLVVIVVVRRSWPCFLCEYINGSIKISIHA